MKKVYSVFLSLFIFVVCLVSLCATESRQITESAAAVSAYTIDTPYFFPITPADSEWQNFETKQEMDKACQIPEQILTKLTTRALLETVLSQPFMSNYVAFNTYADAAKNFYDTFNGFRELMSREDLTAVLLAAYDGANVLRGEENEESITYGHSRAYFRVSDLEFIIAYDRIANGERSAEEENTFRAIHSEKKIARENMGTYSDFDETYLVFMSQENLLSVQDTGYTAYTPNVIS